jgi:hypothetical protein
VIPYSRDPRMQLTNCGFGARSKLISSFLSWAAAVAGTIMHPIAVDKATTIAPVAQEFRYVANILFPIAFSIRRHTVGPDTEARNQFALFQEKGGSHEVRRGEMARLAKGHRSLRAQTFRSRSAPGPGTTRNVITVVDRRI